MMRGLYEVVLFIYIIGYVPILLLRKKWHGGFVERFGFISQETLQKLAKTKNIWIHAVSVGEVMAIGGLIGQLALKFPKHQIVLTTATVTGYELAQKKFADSLLLLWAPIDLSFSVQGFIRAINPKIYVAAETELWPNLFYYLNKKKTPIVIVNGRISDKSFSKYLRIRWFMKHFLKYVNAFCMQSSLDVQRIEAIGAPPDRVRNLGNVKFDDLPEASSKSKGDFGFLPDERVWVAGSTHPGEERIVLEIYEQYRKQFPKLRLVIAPRHIERTAEIQELIQSYGLKCCLLSKFSSRPDPASILLVDTIGQLRQLYAIAFFVFVGKSLTVPGGHNIIEPAFFAKPVAVGPHMQNFRDVMQTFVEGGSIIEVKDAQDLGVTVGRFLNDPAFANEIGRRARNVIAQEQGATMKIIKEISRWME